MKRFLRAKHLPLALLIALCVPVVVAGPSHANGGDRHAQFTRILQQYVTDGIVNYKDLCDDLRLEAYLEQLSSTDPAKLDDNERLAFWINAYNAFTLKIVCDHYPIESINDLHFGGLVIGTITKKTVWDKEFIRINGEELSLNNIEHKIIRKEFDEPRIHFAVVCASVSCPALRNEAFEGHRLDEMLDDQTRIFLNDASKNAFDAAERTARISKIFDWYGKDFGNKQEMLRFIAGYIDGEAAQSIRSETEEWKVKHQKYDWSLNE